MLEELLSHASVCIYVSSCKTGISETFRVLIALHDERDELLSSSGVSVRNKAAIGDKKRPFRYSVKHRHALARI